MKPESLKKVLIIGSQHLDVAWLWKREPVGDELMRMVFELALDLAERNPDSKFIMSRSTAWGYSIVEKRWPLLFARVKKAVEQGGVELCGGQWVEPDNLIPSGESLVRQSLYGQQYFLSRFGKTASVAWNPDAFGHGSTLPQIFKKAEIDGYYFHRLIPEDDAGTPINQFVWEAPDGSRVLCFAGNWKAKPDRYALEQVFETTARAGHPADMMVTGANSDRRMTIGADWLDLPALLKEEYGLDECRWAGADDMLALMSTYRDELPVLQGNFGGFMFTGTYTSDQITKRFNRRLENELALVELVNTWSHMNGGTYYTGLITDAWRGLCVNHFHDIICGTSYRAVQEEAHELYRQVERDKNRAFRHAHEELSAVVRTDEQGGVPYIVYNPVACVRDDPVTIALEQSALFRIVSSSGAEVLSQVVEEDGSSRIVFLPEPLAPFGVHVYYLQHLDAATIRRDDDLILENEYVRVVFDISYGSIVSFYDKRQNFEYVKEGTRANRIVTYEDKNDYPAAPDHGWDPWFIKLTGKRYDPHGAYTVYVKDCGGVRKTICVERSMHICPDRPESVIIQEISLYRNSPMLHIKMHGVWQAEQACVKAEFDLPFTIDTVACDMPYGIVERPSVYGAAAHAEKGSDRDEPDRPMQMWIDISDGEQGLAFINNGKYGYDSTESKIGLTLMRAPCIRPGEVAGLGPFEFSYALYPHAGSWRDAGIPALACLFNRETVALRTWSHGGDIAAGTSLFSVNDPTVSITVVKKAERGNAVILRLFQTTGEDRDVLILSYYPVRSAKEVNAIERDVDSERLELVNDRTIKVRVGRFEFITIMLEV